MDLSIPAGRYRLTIRPKEAHDVTALIEVVYTISRPVTFLQTLLHVVSPTIVAEDRFFAINIEAPLDMGNTRDIARAAAAVAVTGRRITAVDVWPKDLRRRLTEAGQPGRLLPSWPRSSPIWRPALAP